MKMKKLLVAAACLPLALMAQEDRYAQITNPRLTSINKEQPRSTFTSYTNEADAVINDRKNGTFRISLNGKWKFNYVENFADRPTDFMSPHTDVSKWPDINVPGNWELQGFGTPIYVNQSYEFCSPGYAPYWDKPNPPYVPKEWNPTGTYRRTFTLPADWDDKEIFLSADGVRGAAFYYLNGKFVGMNKDSKTPARFNVTSFARRGENVIAIQVHRFSDGNYLECQDFWRISGIERDIYMYAQPQIHLTDFKAETPLDADYRNGILKLKVKFANETGKEIPFTVGYRLLNSKDEQIAQSSARASYGQTEVEFTPKTIKEPLRHKYYAEQGCIRFEIEIHGLHPEMSDEAFKEISNAFNGRENGYLTNGLDSRDNYYMKRVYLACVRAIDFLTSLPEWDGKNVIAQGGSQGGALALITAGLDQRVTACVANHPALSDMAGYKAGRAGGYPHFFRNSVDMDTPEKIKTMAYYDVVNFAKLIKADTYMTWGFNDDVCPPTTSYIVYNVLNCPKEALITPINEHWTSNDTEYGHLLWIKEAFKVRFLIIPSGMRAILFSHNLFSRHTLFSS